MLGNMSGPTLIVILFIVLLLFGAPKLPALAKSLGQSMKILKKEVAPEDAAATPAADTAEKTEAAEQSAAEKLAEAEAKLAEAQAEIERQRNQAE